MISNIILKLSHHPTKPVEPYSYETIQQFVVEDINKGKAPYYLSNILTMYFLISIIITYTDGTIKELNNESMAS